MTFLFYYFLIDSFASTFNTNTQPYAQQYQNDDYDEPPLLEELEIYPEQIIEKSLAILNPFHFMELPGDNLRNVFENLDLIGPILFCVVFAAGLFVKGSEAHFGYIYGLSLTSVIFMYFLITLMSGANQTTNISVSGVASILGYCLLPVVWLSLIGIFVSLNSAFGLIVSVASVLLSTVGSSKIFCLMTGDPNQRFLIAYPCALIYIIFVLLVAF